MVGSGFGVSLGWVWHGLGRVCVFWGGFDVIWACYAVGAKSPNNAFRYHMKTKSKETDENGVELVWSRIVTTACSVWHDMRSCQCQSFVPDMDRHLDSVASLMYMQQPFQHQVFIIRHGYAPQLEKRCSREALSVGGRGCTAM